MKEEALNDALLRQFILGKVSDEVRQRLEELFLTDAVMRERVLAAEQDLIEDYLEDSLTTEDKERFVLRYAQTPAQQRKLRIARSIKDWAATETAAISAVPSTEERQMDSPIVASSIWSRVGERVWRRPVFVLAVAAVAIVALMLGIVWVSRWMEQRRHSSIEQELAQLNTPSSLGLTPPGMEVKTLTPLTFRGSSSSPELELRNEAPVVELRLLWVRREQYPTYQAAVRRIRDDKTFTIPGLRVEEDDEKKVRLRLSPHILTRGTYQIKLTGLAADGTAGPTEAYQFTVGE